MLDYKAENITGFLSKVLPWLCLFVVALALVVTFSIGRSDLAIRGSSIAIPIALAAIVAIVKPGLFNRDTDVTPPDFEAKSSHFGHLALLFFLLFTVNLCLLLSSETRPLAYFILTAVMAGVILFEILSLEHDNGRQKGIILLQIVFLFLGITLGQTLKLPFFFGDTDIFGHMRNISFILEEGFVTENLLGYQYFPLFHIFNAIGVFITGLPLERSYFVVNGLMFAFSIPLIYLLIKRMTDSKKLPLIATLFYVLMSEIMFSGMYTITRTMAFVIAFMVLYLLLRTRRDLRFRILAIFSIIPLILTHQMTLIFFSIILALIAIIEFILYRRFKNISFNFQMLFIIIYIGYWMYLAGPFFEEIIGMINATSGVAPVPESGALQLDWSTYMLANSPFIIIAFMAILGILGQLLRGDKNGKPAGVFALLSLIALFFFLPGLSNYLLPYFINYRIPLMVTPFIAFAAGSGLYFLIRQWHTFGLRRAWGALGVVLLVIFSFSSITILANQTDFDIGDIVGKQNQKYFTEAELESFSFLRENRSEDSYIYSDHETHRYFVLYLRLPSISYIKYLDTSLAEEGYFVFREEEYLSRGRLQFLIPAPDVENFNRDIVTVYKLNEGDDPLETWEEQNKIYSNSSVHIYSKREM